MWRAGTIYKDAHSPARSYMCPTFSVYQNLILPMIEARAVSQDTYVRVVLCLVAKDNGQGTVVSTAVVDTDSLLDFISRVVERFRRHRG